MVEKITSTQNPKIKHLLALQEKSRLRRECGVFVVEGRRELEHCLASGFRADSVFFCPSLSDKPLDGILAGLEDSRLFEVSAEVYSKIAYRSGTEGIIAEICERVISLDDIHLRQDGNAPLVVILESVEKPGNLGAVLRSADAAGADAVIICDPLTDLYNPNLIRASIGAIFTVPTVACTSGEAISWLKKNGIKILTAQLQDSKWYYDTDMKTASAIVIGTEADGLTDQWRQAADAHIRIPMLGRLDSLNASVSASILLFEAVRQRNA